MCRVAADKDEQAEAVHQRSVGTKPRTRLAPKSAEGPFWELKDVPRTKDLALNQETFRNRNPRLHSQKLVSAFQPVYSQFSIKATLQMFQNS